MKAVSFLVILAAAVLLSGVSASGQVPTATPDDALRTFEVRLPVTVTHKKDLVAGLKRGDFAVFEDGVQQEVTFFTSDVTNPPVYVGVLMDTSPSTAGKLQFSREAADQRFLEPRQRVFLPHVSRMETHDPSPLLAAHDGSTGEPDRV